MGGGALDRQECCRDVVPPGVPLDTPRLNRVLSLEHQRVLGLQAVMDRCRSRVEIAHQVEHPIAHARDVDSDVLDVETLADFLDLSGLKRKRMPTPRMLFQNPELAARYQWRGHHHTGRIIAGAARVIPKGDLVWQHSDAVQQRADADGNWLRQTDATITDQSTERNVQAMSNAERYQMNTVEVDEHSTESVGGIKTLEALGALKLLSAGSASMAALGDLHITTGHDLNVVVEHEHTTTVGGDMQERIRGARQSVASVAQRFKAPATWLGSETTNVLTVLCDLIDLVEAMSTAIAGHTHAPKQPPLNTAQFVAHAESAAALYTELAPLTE